MAAMSLRHSLNNRECVMGKEFFRCISRYLENERSGIRAGTGRLFGIAFSNALAKRLGRVRRYTKLRDDRLAESYGHELRHKQRQLCKPRNRDLWPSLCPGRCRFALGNRRDRWRDNGRKGNRSSLTKRFGRSTKS